MCVEIHVCAHTHPLGAAPNFHACVEKKDKSAHAHVGVHEELPTGVDPCQLEKLLIDKTAKDITQLQIIDDYLKFFVHKLVLTPFQL